MPECRFLGRIIGLGAMELVRLLRWLLYYCIRATAAVNGPSEDIAVWRGPGKNLQEVFAMAC